MSRVRADISIVYSRYVKSYSRYVKIKEFEV
jgi:hypothetical protein